MSSSSGDGDGDGGEPKLPRDVVVEILKRLPVKSLLRFRCVCQSWRSAIDDPAFVALHSRHSALNASNWYLVFQDYHGDFKYTWSLFTLPSQLRVEIPFVTPLCFVGSCNGLLGVADVTGERRYMYLWNLFTRKQKAVRLFPRPGEPQFLYKAAPAEFVGFGFDAESNDYKIVRILHFLVDGRWFGRVGIYSLRTDSWRSLGCEVPAFTRDDKVVFLNGNLHWIAFKLPMSKDASLFVFDVAGEVFDEMALPENTSGSLTVSVAVLNDSLTVFSAETFVDDCLCSTYSAWVMREYGVPQSWTKLYNIKINAVVEGFCGWMFNGELLMEIDSSHGKRRISMDRIKNKATVLPISGMTYLVTVVESLVSPEI